LFDFSFQFCFVFLGDEIIQLCLFIGTTQYVISGATNPKKHSKEINPKGCPYLETLNKRQELSKKPKK
jgi:hypothetical protein